MNNITYTFFLIVAEQMGAFVFQVVGSLANAFSVTIVDFGGKNKT